MHSGLHLHLRGACQPSPSFPSICAQISKWISFTFKLGDFQTAVFFTWSQGKQSCTQALQEGNSVPTALWDPWMSTLFVFQARCSGALLFWCRSQGMSYPCETPTPCSSRIVCLVRSLPIMCCLPWVGFFERHYLCLSYPPPCGPCILCCAEKFISFSDFFQKEMIHV